VIPCERLHPWTELVKYPGFETFDHIIAAELKLYIHLYEAIYHTVSSVSEAWEMVNGWGRKYLGGEYPNLTVLAWFPKLTFKKRRQQYPKMGALLCIPHFISMGTSKAE
jgi:hypothetical protein